MLLSGVEAHEKILLRLHDAGVMGLDDRRMDAAQLKALIEPALEELTATSEVTLKPVTLALLWEMRLSISQLLASWIDAPGSVSVIADEDLELLRDLTNLIVDTLLWHGVNDE
jgi:hypothetical protein